jgi:putative endonuclease
MMQNATGVRAEQLAEEYLLRQGLTLVERNFRCRMGEIDLILRDRDTLVFAEVRLRSASDFGGAAASVDRAKQARVSAAALHFLAGKRERPCRFDVVVLDRLAPEAIEWIKDAFAA